MMTKKEPPSDKTKAQAGQSPPSYTTLYPQHSDAAPRESPQASRPHQPTPASAQRVENINTLRDSNPRLPLDPPLPTSTRLETAEAAARTAMLGVGLAFAEYKKDPALAAAHTAHAIAVAVSTSRSYTAFVAATTSAESAALIMSESFRHKIPEGCELDRLDNAIRSATESGMAAEAGNTANGTWPCSTHETDAM